MIAKLRSLWPGAVAAAVPLAALWAASGIVPQIPFPPYALGDRIVRLIPGAVATTAIDQLQHNALRLLAGGTVTVFVIGGSLLPVLLRRGKQLYSYLAGALFGLASLVATLVDPVPQNRPAAFASAVFAAGAYAAVLAGLETYRRRPRAVASSDTGPVTRRTFLVAGASATGTSITAGALARIYGWNLAPASVSLKGGARPDRVSSRARFPSVSGLSPEITSVADHYVVDIDISDPVVDAGSWKLSIDGLVEDPLALTFSGLQSEFRLVDQHSVLTCISNKVGGPLVGSSRWTGVRLREVLERAGLRDSAQEVIFRCADGYSVGIPLELANEPSALLALAQNGQPLARAHGFPCRVRVPALYGMMNPKWLESIEVTASRYEGYWQQQGWTDMGFVRTESRIDTPRRASAGLPTWIAGVAWAGTRRVSKVEVSVDGGRSWAPALLHEPLSPLAWTQWAYRWTPPRVGRYPVRCRATDGRGVRQDQTRRPPHPSGASGYHEIEVEVA